MTITQEELKKNFYYSPETGLFTRLTMNFLHQGGAKKGAIAGSQSARDGYIVICHDRKRYFAHRLAWFYVHGKWPTHGIDHINRIKHDNRLLNLREATQAQNVLNTNIAITNSSGFKGVSWDKSRSKWFAKARLQGKQIPLGRFDDLYEARDAYLEFAKKHHGEFFATTTEVSQ